jgi:hypothetical protein
VNSWLPSHWLAWGLVGIQTGFVQSPIPFSSRQLVCPPIEPPFTVPTPPRRLGEAEEELFEQPMPGIVTVHALEKKKWLAARCRCPMPFQLGRRNYVLRQI